MPTLSMDSKSEASGREAHFRFFRGRVCESLPRRAPPVGSLAPVLALEDGVQFPAVHWTWSGDVDDSIDSWAAGSGFNVVEEMYREVRCLRPEGCPDREQSAWLKRTGPDPGCCYVVLGFPAAHRSLTNALLATWRDWSGARYLYLHLPDEMRLSRVSLLQRQFCTPNADPKDPNSHPSKPNGPSTIPFYWLVVAECRCAHSPMLQARLLDFVQRLRAQRVSAYVSVYTAAGVATNGLQTLTL